MIMTLDEAIKHAEEDAKIPEFDIEAFEYVEDCRQLAEWLKELKLLKEQESCEDCISRQAVLDLIVANHTELNGINVVMYSPLYKDIKQLPSVTPQPKTGHWTRTVDKAEYLVWECNCGWQQRFATNYCPNCGAKMTESEK